MESDLAMFRPRLLNWARVYKDRASRSVSSTQMVCDRLKRYDLSRPLQKEYREAQTALDYVDAKFIDDCVCYLRTYSDEFARLFSVIKAEYLTKYSVEDYESQRDYDRNLQARARAAHCFAGAYDKKLARAEKMILETVKKREGTF